jgi:L-type amino acid transporter 9
MAEWSFLFLDVLGLIILRWREPELNRPYRVNLIIPITFCIVVIFVVAASSVHAPIQSFVLLALTLFNIAVYRFKAHTFHH